MEFIYVIGIVIFVSIILTKSMMAYYDNKRDDENIYAANDIVSIVENEIFLASKVIPGYTRSFEIPYQINNVNYNISIHGDEILLNYKDITFTSYIPNVTGNVVKGANIIKNIDGRVCLNVATC